MRVVRGINPDYADFDEIDEDARDAFQMFDRGEYSYSQLVSLVGKEAAQAHVGEFTYRADNPIASLFDDPEALGVGADDEED